MSLQVTGADGEDVSPDRSRLNSLSESLCRHTALRGRSEVSCLENCVDRFMDSHIYVLKQFQAQQQQHM